MGGSLQMLRDGVWHFYDKDNVWLSFDALKVTHRVNEVLRGNRYSNTLCTPGKLDRMTPSDWDTLSRTGFPIYLCEVHHSKCEDWRANKRCQVGRRNLSHRALLRQKRWKQAEPLTQVRQRLAKLQMQGLTPGRILHCQALLTHQSNKRWILRPCLSVASVLGHSSRT